MLCSSWADSRGAQPHWLGGPSHLPSLTEPRSAHSRWSPWKTGTYASRYWSPSCLRMQSVVGADDERLVAVVLEQSTAGCLRRRTGRACITSSFLSPDFPSPPLSSPAHLRAFAQLEVAEAERAAAQRLAAEANERVWFRRCGRRPSAAPGEGHHLHATIVMEAEASCRERGAGKWVIAHRLLWAHLPLLATLLVVRAMDPVMGEWAGGAGGWGHAGPGCRACCARPRAEAKRDAGRHRVCVCGKGTWGSMWTCGEAHHHRRTLSLPLLSVSHTCDTSNHRKNDTRSCRTQRVSPALLPPPPPPPTAYSYIVLFSHLPPTPQG